MRTLYIRFMLPIIAILLVATALVLTPVVMHSGVAPTSHSHTISAPDLARGNSH